MLNKFKLVFLCFLLLGMTTCNSSKNGMENKDALMENNFLSVCEIAGDVDLYNRKIVKVKATMYGYHGLVLSDARCPDKENLLSADFDTTTYLELLDAQKDLNLKRTDIKGEIFLEGRILKDGGKLNYPYEQIFRPDELGKYEPEIVIVNKIFSIRVLRFIPKLED